MDQVEGGRELTELTTGLRLQPVPALERKIITPWLYTKLACKSGEGTRGRQHPTVGSRTVTLGLMMCWAKRSRLGVPLMEHGGHRGCHPCGRWPMVRRRRQQRISRQASREEESEKRRETDCCTTGASRGDGWWVSKTTASCSAMPPGHYREGKFSEIGKRVSCWPLDIPAWLLSQPDGVERKGTVKKRKRGMLNVWQRCCGPVVPNGFTTLVGLARCAM